MIKSQIFLVYNTLKGDIEHFPQIELGRLNRALGLALRKDVDFSKYSTSTYQCDCPDNRHRGTHVCKHRLAYIMRNPLEAITDRLNGEGIWKNPKAQF